MADDDPDPTVLKGRIVDNMSIVDEYTTSMIAAEVGLPNEDVRPYLEELAEEDRIRKRDRGDVTKWVRFR
jgi:predicted ArsR family transcriptional regulator